MPLLKPHYYVPEKPIAIFPLPLPVDNSILEGLVQDLINVTKLQDEILTQTIGDPITGEIIGTISYIRNEETGAIESEVYTDNTGSITTTKPIGVLSSGKPDFEFIIDKVSKCLTNGDSVREIFVEVRKDNVTLSTEIFWIVSGVKVTVDPGVMDCEATVRTHIGDEILNFTGSSVVTLTAPVNANLAEIQVQGGSIQYMFGTDPTAAGMWAGNGQRIEAESKDEIDKLQIIGYSGNSGTLVIHYFNINQPDGNN